MSSYVNFSPQAKYKYGDTVRLTVPESLIGSLNLTLENRHKLEEMNGKEYEVSEMYFTDKFNYALKGTNLEVSEDLLVLVKRKEAPRPLSKDIRQIYQSDIVRIATTLIAGGLSPRCNNFEEEVLYVINKIEKIAGKHLEDE